MMNDAVKAFHTQFAFEPQVENAEKLGRYKSFALCGMGGSANAIGLVKAYRPDIDLVIHKDYGLPALGDAERGTRLFIMSSYSGNTEETLDAFEKGIAAGVPVAVICVGGKLLAAAKKAGVPYVVMPNTGVQPRAALGFSMLGLMKLMGLEEGIQEAKKLAQTLDPITYEMSGKAMAEKLRGRVPVIYTSTRYMYVAYNWKIKLNETGKIPAFYNLVPEMNHNEMNGFDVKDSSRALSEKFYFLVIRSFDDDPRLVKRMDTMVKLYRDRGLGVEVLDLVGGTVLENMFRCLLLADWTSIYVADMYGLEAEQVPMIEEFKKMIA